MRSIGRWLDRIFAPWLRPSRLPAIVAFATMLVMATYAAWQNQVLYDEQMHARVNEELNLVRARLEGSINGNLQLVRGLVATLSTEPDMTQERFADLAEKTFEQHSQLRHVAAAPDLVVRLMYPLAGNEKAIGLDYRENDAQRAAALRARDIGNVVLAGPVNLVQGGQGFIGRFPLFVGEGADRRFWGIVSAVIDSHLLFKDSGLLSPDLGIDVSISGRDGIEAGHGRFFGPEIGPEQRPVTADVLLPVGSWQLRAIPRGGWPTVSPTAWMIWLGFLFGAVLVTAPVLVAGRLVEERQRNLGELRQRERELERLSRRLGLALETSQVGVFEFNLATDMLLWDDRVNALFGLPQDGGPRQYRHWRDALHPDDLQRAEQEFDIACKTGGGYHSNYRIITPKGEVRNVRAIGAVYRDTDGSSRIVGVNWDVSADVALNDSLKQANRLLEARNAELETAKTAIEHNALHDSLTGLPNRRYLDELLHSRATQPAPRGDPVGMLHIDLDRFKQINDTLGHAAGDAMLVQVADILRHATSSTDFVARIGGDEFVVVSRRSDAKHLARLAERIIVETRKPLNYEGHECRFGVSVGIAVESDDIDANRLLIDADIALYRAKSRGRNRFEFFTPTLQAEVVRTKRVADEILNAIEGDQFEPYFQPQFDARTYEVVGVEALARWRHPTRGCLAPAHFLDIAEDLSVVATIDRTILEKALVERKRWQAAGIAIPRIAVNVSGRRLQDDQLLTSLRLLGIEPGTVSFELVESIYLDETDEMVRWNIDQIKELGIDIEIDDFGTGYASIVSLMQLKPRRLKIDRQLVMPVVDSVTQRRLVASIVDIGRSLGIEVLGEGVETMAHARILRDLGCVALQGFAFAAPMPSDELVTFLRDRPWMANIGTG